MAKRRQIRYNPQNDLYHVLGVRASASADEIQRAFRQRAKEVHPDRNPGKLEWANEQFRRLNEAYDVLGDSATREEYDFQRRRYHPNEHPSGAGYTPPQPPPSYRPPPPPGTKFTPRARAGRSSTVDFYADVLGSMFNGPYRYVIAILALVLFANLVFITTTQSQINAATQLQTQTSQVSTSQALTQFMVVTLPSPGVMPTLTPTCDNPGVVITKPAANDAINFQTFDVIGAAIHPNFKEYTVEVDSLPNTNNSGKTTRWILQTPIQQPVSYGVLVKNASIQNIPEGFYVLRLRVVLNDGSALAPCEVPIRRKR